MTSDRVETYVRLKAKKRTADKGVMTRSLLPRMLGLLLVSGSLFVAPPAEAACRPGPAVAYQVDVRHSGAQRCGSLAPPLAQKWLRSFSGEISYPLIVKGKVFVTVDNGPDSYGSTVYALSQDTGEVIWSRAVGHVYSWSNAAYDAGRVFYLTYDGLLQAFDQASGRTLWTKQLPNQWSFTSAPVAANGVVYTSGAGSGGTVYAVSQRSGGLLWTRSVANGDYSSPALSPLRVYVSYSCPHVYGLWRETGAVSWHYGSGCSGGGGKTAVFHNERLYVRDSGAGYVFNATNGTLVDSFSSVPAPAFAGEAGLFVSGGQLRAADVTTGQTKWTFVGDAGLRTAPIISNGHAYVGSSTGKLFAVALSDGSEAWSTNVGAAIPAPDEHNVSQPLTGLAAGQRLLVVPAGNLLVAYGNA